jgi:hypothetical protein
MLLKGIEGTHFGLRILGYQFPQGGDSANWLNIEVDAAFSSGEWKAVDPALETFEVALLADWFDALAAGEPTGDEMYFIEPNLEFKRINRTGARTLVRVQVEGELRPSWGPRHTVKDLSADFALDSDALRAAAKSLRQQLQRFPPLSCP